MSRRMAFLHLPPIRWLTSFYNPPLNNAEANFELKNIPTLDEKGNLIVNADSTPIFAALLENKIIQRLLNNDIEIPYYKKD